jgi:metallo-beta-lactamase family protein
VLELTFLGASGTVTGSKYLLRYGNRHLLIDCGLFQGDPDWISQNGSELPLPARDIQALLLTHAHTDHAGGVPWLVRQGFRGSIWCTEPTYSLCELMWPDSARLQLDSEQPPLFDDRDVSATLKLIKERPYYQEFEVVPGVRATFNDAGHILGSAWIELTLQPLPEWPCQDSVQLIFSGDLGRANSRTLAPPDRCERAHFLVLESTYGDRTHKSASPDSHLCEAVQRVVRQRSTLLIPAFAVQRCQDLVYLFDELHKDGQIADVSLFLDSPMAAKAVDVFEDFPDYLNLEAGQKLNHHEMLLRYPFLQICHTSRQSKAIHDFAAPRVIVSASGMCEGGRVLHHLKRHLPDPRSTILLAGYQCEGTRGHQLLNGAGEIEIDAQSVAVKARIEALEGMSGHADYSEIGDWLDDLKEAPRCTFLVHGDAPALAAQHERLSKERGWSVQVPTYGQKFDLLESLPKR